jgi:hypothetical protein
MERMMLFVHARFLFTIINKLYLWSECDLLLAWEGCPEDIRAVYNKYHESGSLFLSLSNHTLNY